MRLHRFIVEGLDLEKEYIRIEDKDILSQIRNVLRLKEKDRIILCDGALYEAEAEIAKIEKNYLEAGVVSRRKNEHEPAIFATLFCAVLKKENFEVVCQKATEIGISKMVPVLTSRTVKMNLKPERLEKIIKEASEQSERRIVPKLEGIMDFSDALKYASENKVNLFFDRSGEVFSKDGISGLRTADLKKIGIFIGPEGGWDQNEIKAARNAGFKIVSMGMLNLRAETAAIIASYLAVNAEA